MMSPLPHIKLELEIPTATIWLWLSFVAIFILYQPTNVHWYNIVTNRGEFVITKSWAYNLTFTVIGELFAAVLQICGGPQKSVGNAPQASTSTITVYSSNRSIILMYRHTIRTSVLPPAG